LQCIKPNEAIAQVVEWIKKIALEAWLLDQFNWNIKLRFCTIVGKFQSPPGN
jgi:hypothetical protein